MTEILELTAADYHADKVSDTPSLSASIASVLVTKSPAHARARHPRLNPDFARVEEQKFDVGNAAHCLFLEGLDRAAVIDAPDWRTKSAKEEREEARAAGLIPLLTEQYAQVAAMVNAVHEQLNAHEADLFVAGKPEQTLVWDEDGVTCRARPDWLRDDHTAICDLKTTSRSAHPRAYERALFNVGGDVQASFYLRGLQAVTGSLRWADFYWCVVETEPPYALSVIQPAADVLELGQRKVEYAIERWRECLRTDSWPAYSTVVEFANAPEWELQRWLAREETEKEAA